MTRIAIENGVVVLPIPAHRVPELLVESDEALAWMFRDFLTRAQDQIEEER